MREIVIFAGIASLAATVFFVALLELIFTTKRAKVVGELTEKVKEIRQSFTVQTNALVQEQEAKLSEAEAKVQAATAEAEEAKKATEAELKAKLAKVKSSSAKEVERAREHAREMEKEAERKADEYLESRKEEVEQELLNLVINVTRKVIPDGISYDVHKELVMRALLDAKTENPDLK